MIKNNKRLYIHKPKANSGSGERFFLGLRRKLSYSKSNIFNAKYSLLNISSPLIVFIVAKILNKKITIRVDGIYSYKYSESLVKSLPVIPRIFFMLASKVFSDKTRLTSTINNYLNLVNFIKIAFSDKIVYQSNFSKHTYSSYFPNKRSKVILNGSAFNNCFVDLNSIKDKSSDINIATIYEGKRINKGFYDCIDFIFWAYHTKGIKCNLFVYGCNSNIYNESNSKLASLISNGIATLYKDFKSYTPILSNEISKSTCFLSLSRYDPCPNVVIEAMSHGIPVLGLTSGGIPEIVGDAGVLIEINELNPGRYYNHRYSGGFARPNFNELLKGLLKIKSNISYYKEKVKERISNELLIDNIADKYYLFCTDSDGVR